MELLPCEGAKLCAQDPFDSLDDHLCVSALFRVLKLYLAGADSKNTLPKEDLTR